VNELAAAVLAAGELVCEFQHGFKRSFIAELAGARRATDLMLVYESVRADSAQVLSSERPGRREVRVRATERAVHLIEPAGPSVRVTTLTGCRGTKWKRGEETCVRFAARYAWHFDTLALKDPDASLARQPTGASTGFCEPWSLD
jgi:hypothetical protein